jgi:hypothetical protein
LIAIALLLLAEEVSNLRRAYLFPDEYRAYTKEKLFWPYKR